MYPSPTRQARRSWTTLISPSATANSWGWIGPNGGGKTTLLKLLLGILKPLSGQVLVMGRPANSLGRDRRLLGYVPQDVTIPKQFPATAFDVALMGTFASLGLFRRPGKFERAAAFEALEHVGLKGFENQPANNLSGGTTAAPGDRKGTCRAAETAASRRADQRARHRRAVAAFRDA